MFSLLLLVACHSTEPWIPPASIVGSFPTNYTLQQAEDVLYDSCLSAKWQVEQICGTLYVYSVQWTNSVIYDIMMKTLELENHYVGFRGAKESK